MESYFSYPGLKIKKENGKNVLYVEPMSNTEKRELIKACGYKGKKAKALIAFLTVKP